MNSSKLSVLNFKWVIHLLNRIMILLIIITSFSSCEEVIDVDLNDAAPQLVVEGWIYDTPGPYEIKLSLTTSYFGNEEAPKIDDALVIVTENSTVTDTLKMTKPGIFKTQKILEGKIGATYQLKIIFENKTYEAIATMKPVTPIDSLAYHFETSSPFRKEGYYVTVFFQDPPVMGNYYRWLFYKNNRVYKPKNLHYASDELYNGNYISLVFRNEVSLNDTVRIEMFSIEKNGYDFFNALDEQDNTGDLFDTPPGNVKGNITNGGIGYFGASSKTVSEIIIK